MTTAKKDKAKDEDEGKSRATKQSEAAKKDAKHDDPSPDEQAHANALANVPAAREYPEDWDRSEHGNDPPPVESAEDAEAAYAELEERGDVPPRTDEPSAGTFETAVQQGKIAGSSPAMAPQNNQGGNTNRVGASEAQRRADVAHGENLQESGAP
jgi:hypothetical protein